MYSSIIESDLESDLFVTKNSGKVEEEGSQKLHGHFDLSGAKE